MKPSTQEHPILFSAPMVRAILEGRKTQTRRIIKPQPDGYGGQAYCVGQNEYVTPVSFDPSPECYLVDCPYGKPGDYLWVRESGLIATDKTAFAYTDYGGVLSPDAPSGSESWCREWKTCPSIFMPRWASRITLEILRVRVERLQEIHHKADELSAEGIRLSPTELYPNINTADKLERHFINLWDSLNEKRGYGWSTNPWVWVLEFRKI